MYYIHSCVKVVLCTICGYSSVCSPVASEPWIDTGHGPAVAVGIDCGGKPSQCLHPPSGACSAAAPPPDWPAETGSLCPAASAGPSATK